MEDKFAKLLDKKQATLIYLALSNDLVNEKFYKHEKEKAMNKVEILTDYKKSDTLDKIQQQIFDSNMKMSINNLIGTGTNEEYQSFYIKGVDDLCPHVMVFNTDEFIEYAADKIAFYVSEFKVFSSVIREILKGMSMSDVVNITSTTHEEFEDEFNILDNDDTFVGGYDAKCFRALRNLKRDHLLVEHLVKRDDKMLKIISKFVFRNGVNFESTKIRTEHTDYFVIPYNESRKPIAGTVTTSGGIKAGGSKI